MRISWKELDGWELACDGDDDDDGDGGDRLEEGSGKTVL